MEAKEEPLSVPSFGDNYCSYKYRTIPTYTGIQNFDLYFSNY